MVNNRKALLTASVVYASEILKCLADGVERLTDITHRLKLNKATVFRLLKTLESSGLALQDPRNKRYYLGPLILQLASKPTISHERLIIYAFDEMKRLRDLNNETVALHIRVGAQRIILEEMPSTQNIRFTLGKGFASSMYIGAAAKLLLSELPESEREMYLNGVKLINPRTNEIIDKEALINELNKIKKEGYAISWDETIQGSAGISVPIRNYVFLVALSMYGPKDRFMPHKMSYLQELKESAERISRKLLEMGA